jgi:hypothetical protein
MTSIVSAVVFPSAMAREAVVEREATARAGDVGKSRRRPKVLTPRQTQ